MQVPTYSQLFYFFHFLKNKIRYVLLVIFFTFTYLYEYAWHRQPTLRSYLFQVERKRHIGNDIVNIVFIDGGPTFMSQFNPTFIKSQFTRILLISSNLLYKFTYRFLQILAYSCLPTFIRNFDLQEKINGIMKKLNELVKTFNKVIKLL